MNSSLLRRLKYYGIGFGIGLLFVFIFFENRGCQWLPGNRVKNNFIGKVLVVSENTQKFLDKNGVTDAELENFLLHGAVAFGKSKKEGNPKVYSISNKVKGKSVELWFTMNDNAYVAEVLTPHGSIFRAKASDVGLGRVAFVPKVDNIIYLPESKQVGVTLNEKQVQDILKKNGWIDFEKTNFEVQPVPEQYLILVPSKGDTLKSWTTWYKDHIQIHQFTK
jgi:hypothetical protein